MAVAFIFHENQLLFLEKASNQSSFYGMALPIGGHIEPLEINKPKEACLREIYEETRLTIEDITDLKLRYIILRIKDSEIRIQYCYFTNAKHKNVQESEEGRLFWRNYNVPTELNLTVTTRNILEHHMALKENTLDIYVGTMKSNDGEPEITWALLEDWEKFKVALS